MLCLTPRTGSRVSKVTLEPTREVEPSVACGASIATRCDVWTGRSVIGWSAWRREGAFGLVAAAFRLGLSGLWGDANASTWAPGREPTGAGFPWRRTRVVVYTPAEIPVDHPHADPPPEQVRHLLGPRQPAKVAVDNDPVEAVIYEYQQLAEQLGNDFHRSSPLRSTFATRSSGKRPMESKSKMFFVSPPRPSAAACPRT